jgi:hypothetical protein
MTTFKFTYRISITFLAAILTAASTAIAQNRRRTPAKSVAAFEPCEEDRRYTWGFHLIGAAVG